MESRWRAGRFGVVGLWLAVSACGPGLPMRAGPLHPGDAEAAPSLGCLPDPDVTDEVLTSEMRIARDLVQESFDIEPPPLPSNRAAQDLMYWSEEILTTWIERKTHRIESARHALDEVAEQSHRQRIIGGAMVGLMYEDVSLILLGIPVPSELDDEPEIAEIYRDVLRGQAHPYLEHARRAYRACARNAFQPESMRHWSHFCQRRADGLPGGQELDGPMHSGETRVEVLID